MDNFETEARKILADFNPSKGIYDALTALLALHKAELERVERKARIDEVSYAIIECYKHDDPMEILKDLGKRRAELQPRQLEGEAE